MPYLKNASLSELADEVARRARIERKTNESYDPMLDAIARLLHVAACSVTETSTFIPILNPDDIRNSYVYGPMKPHGAYATLYSFKDGTEGARLWLYPDEVIVPGHHLAHEVHFSSGHPRLEPLKGLPDEEAAEFKNGLWMRRS